MEYGLCPDSNEDRGTREHFANLDQMAIWSMGLLKVRPKVNKS